MNGGVGVLALAGIGLWLWSQRGKVAAAVKLPETIAAAKAMTAEQAEALLASPGEVVADNQAFVATHPTAYSMIQQANTQIASGQASVGDIMRFQIDKAYYSKYVAEGGIATYEDFTLYSEHWTPEYEAAKEAAKDKELSYRVADIEASGIDYVEHMLETLTPGGWLYEGLAARHPELAAKVEEPEVIPSATVEEVVAGAEQGTVPESFTASVEQLNELEEAGYTQESPEYEAAVDYAYEAAAAIAAEQEAATGESHSVSWSSDGGYSTVSESEAPVYLF